MGAKWSKSKIDLEQLRYEIRNMSPQSKLSILLKEELTKIKRWCVMPRGNPQKGYLVSRRNKNR